MHGILVFLGHLADCANKLAGGILLIFHRHVATGSGRARVQFFHRLRVPPPRRLIPITGEPIPRFLTPGGILLKKAATHWFSGFSFLLLTELLLSRALADLDLRLREEGIYLLPSFCAVRAVPSFAIILLFEPFLRPTAKGVVPVPCIWLALPRCRISIEAAVFLSAGPAPRLSAALAHVEFVLVIKAAGKDIITRRVLECPTTAPGAAFCISRTGLWHLSFRRKEFPIGERRNDHCNIGDWPGFSEEVGACFTEQSGLCCQAGLQICAGGGGVLGPNKADSVVKSRVCLGSTRETSRRRTYLSFRRRCHDYESGAPSGRSSSPPSAGSKGSVNDDRFLWTSELGEYADAEYGVAARLVEARG